jgi:predicted N-acetyltransferase YhbS
MPALSLNLLIFFDNSNGAAFMSPESQLEFVIRQAVPADSAACGQICFDAFSTINQAHGFPCDFPSPEVTIGLLTALISDPSFYCAVAESNGRILGSNCLDERSIILGVGPITIDPAVQSRGVGRKLMEAVIFRADGNGAAGVRLVQAAFHNRSLSLYESLGFDVREPLSCMQGKTAQRSVPGCQVRPAQLADLEACNELSRRVHGFARGTDLMQAIERGTALVVERENRVTGYTSHLALFGHAVAETNLDMKALIASGGPFAGSGILVPSRNNELFRWCRANGLRVVQPMTLMTMGLYNEPSGAWLPSVIY